MGKPNKEQRISKLQKQLQELQTELEYYREWEPNALRQIWFAEEQIREIESVINDINNDTI